MVVKMMDKKSSGLKTVYIMDTSSAAANIDVTRTLRGGVQEAPPKPRIVTTYSKGMKGVDQRDASVIRITLYENHINGSQKLVCN